MAQLSRKGDQNQAGGKIVRGASTVFANGIQVGLNVSDITPHPSGSKHKKAKTTEGSPTVFAEGVAVLRVGSGNTCGHKITQGSPDVYVP
jgi:uncharacterized Zn-binding protein involved in type VI secretion